jgi:hypothetical protein
MIHIFMKPLSLVGDWLASRFLNPCTIATFSCFNGEKGFGGVAQSAIWRGKD